MKRTEGRPATGDCETSHGDELSYLLVEVAAAAQPPYHRAFAEAARLMRRAVAQERESAELGPQR